MAALGRQRNDRTHQEKAASSIRRVGRIRYSIREHPALEGDLFEIVEMISSCAGVAVGLAKTDEITESIESLADLQKIGTVRDDFNSGLRAIPASEKAVVCFSVDDKCISYARADWMSRVRDRS